MARAQRRASADGIDSAREMVIFPGGCPYVLNPGPRGIHARAL